MEKSKKQPQTLMYTKRRAIAWDKKTICKINCKWFLLLNFPRFHGCGFKCWNWMNVPLPALSVTVTLCLYNNNHNNLWIHGRNGKKGEWMPLEFDNVSHGFRPMIKFKFFPRIKNRIHSCVKKNMCDYLTENHNFASDVKVWNSFFSLTFLKKHFTRKQEVHGINQENRNKSRMQDAWRRTQRKWNFLMECNFKLKSDLRIYETVL